MSRTACRYTFSTRTGLRAHRDGKRVSVHAVRSGRVWSGAQLTGTLPPWRDSIDVVAVPVTAGNLASIRDSARVYRGDGWAPRAAEHLTIMAAAGLDPDKVRHASDVMRMFAAAPSGATEHQAADLVLRAVLTSHFPRHNSPATAAQVNAVVADILGRGRRLFGETHGALEADIARLEADPDDEPTRSVEIGVARHRFEVVDAASSPPDEVARALHTLTTPDPRFV